MFEAVGVLGPLAQVGLISKHSEVLSRKNTIVAISVSHYALDTNKTEGEWVQNETTDTYIFLNRLDFYVSLVLYQFAQVQFSVIRKVLIHCSIKRIFFLYDMMTNFAR